MLDDLIPVLLRMIHIMAAIIWIGHVYVNMVMRPSFEPLRREELSEDADDGFTKRMKREHSTFRHASIVTWVTGFLLLWHSGRLADAAMLNGADAVIGVGGWIGTIMTLNVWLILWPHQKKVLGFVPAPFEERARCARITFLTSRTNAMLSVPLFFFMVSSSFGLGLF
ncbi:MAG: urate hydroxylase PuuD [Alphaproteobacteria bacterium]|nr:urate hydroxylase PuuD [Alphaproteobacteria bacterium]